MTNQQPNPITPSPELVRQWQREADHNEPMLLQVANQAAQWGADQEKDIHIINQGLLGVATRDISKRLLLEACCALMDDWGLDETDLLFASRPKPLRLKEQALVILNGGFDYFDDAQKNIIRTALEALPND